VGLNGNESRGSFGEGKNTQMGEGARKEIMKGDEGALHGNGKKVNMEGGGNKGFMGGNISENQGLFYKETQGLRKGVFKGDVSSVYGPKELDQTGGDIGPGLSPVLEKLKLF
jgi:hypothetical protein